MCLRNDRGTPIAGFRTRQIYQKICHLDNFFYVIQHGRRFVLLGMMANQQYVSELCIRYFFENILTPKKVCLSRLYNFTSRFGSVCHFQYHASIFELTFGICWCAAERWRDVWLTATEKGRTIWGSWSSFFFVHFHIFFEFSAIFLCTNAHNWCSFLNSVLLIND